MEATKERKDNLKKLNDNYRSIYTHKLGHKDNTIKY
jgi:hypothetical protein